MSPAWQALEARHQSLSDRPLADLVRADRTRFERFSVGLDGLLYDFSRQHLDAGALEALLALAEERDLAGWRARLYAGEAVNASEQRPALHMALRARAGDEWVAGGEAVTDMVLAERARCHAFADELCAGGRIADVVNLGIGGSHLGPALICDALGAAYGRERPRAHFVANADGADIGRVLAQCRPESTLFIVASKTFTTQETLLNATSARNWLTAALGDGAAAAHFAAVTAHPDRAALAGIPGRQVFAMFDWVGGRYSLWSAIGLPAMIALGRGHFDALLDGAREIDLHFRDAPPERNIPVLMGLIGVWNRNFAGASSHAVLPYAEALRRLPAYLQQLVMESLGKRVDRDGREVDYATAPVVWGMPGTRGQHAFHQLLHQGTDPVPVDFIGFREAVEGPDGHRHVLLANLIAQAEALLIGRGSGDAQRDCPGGRPSSVLLFDRLDPRNLGRLIALYEHQVFVQSVIWNLNPFDQWGVELGKQLGRPLLEELAGGARGEHDPATAGLLDYLTRK